MTDDRSEFDDIPGTTVFTVRKARQGYHLNKFCMSLMKPDNRERFLADERAYLDQWRMTEEQKQAVLDRDYGRMIALGGNIYFLAKVFATDGETFFQAAASMTGMPIEEYQAMMLAGGRNIDDGWRSKRERGAAEQPSQGGQ